MEYVLIWAVLSALVGAAIGNSKGRAAAGAAWGLFLGPLGWLVMAMVPDVRVKCPDCGGEVVPGARKCKNCGSMLRPAIVHTPTPRSHIVEHTKEYAALAEWMRQHGFNPRDTAATTMEQKADSHYLTNDYQWYEGSYNGSPIFFVLIKIDHRNQIEVIPCQSGEIRLRTDPASNG
jgi:hypothetical protein